MKITHFPAAIAAVALLVPSLSQAQSNGSWNTTISPAAGGTKTAVSFFATGTFLTGFSYPVSTSINGTPIGFSGIEGSPAGAWSFSTNTFFTVTPFGYGTNITTGVSRTLTSLAFITDGTLAALFDAPLPFSGGDVLAFVLDTTPVNVELDVAFSNFTPGTYNGVMVNSAFPDGAAYNMEIVPEPSTYALLALAAAGLGAHVLQRRRKQNS